MACINMVNSEHQGLCGVPAVPPPIGPRISFSSDFVVERPPARNPGPPPDPNFEFAVGGDSMIDADKLFFKGRLLPLKESHQCGPQRITTLKEELRASNEWERPLRGSIKWKELLGLKKSHCSSAAKKSDKPVQEEV